LNVLRDDPDSIAKVGHSILPEVKQMARDREAVVEDLKMILYWKSNRTF
jgi:hypothetical protein